LVQWFRIAKLNIACREYQKISNEDENPKSPIGTVKWDGTVSG